jgi:hypothetical protein
VIGEERNALHRQHVEDARAAGDGLLAVGIESELKPRALHHHHVMVRDVARIAERFSLRRDLIDGMADGVAGRRHA